MNLIHLPQLDNIVLLIEGYQALKDNLEMTNFDI